MGFSCLRWLLRAGAAVLAATAFLLGAWEVHLRREVSKASARAPNLDVLKAMDEADLTRDDFYKEYVLKQKPVKIRLARPDLWNATDMMHHCGKSRSHQLSVASAMALRQVKDIVWLRFAFEWLFMPLIGRWTTLEREMESRLNVPLEEYLPYVEKAEGRLGQDFSLGLPLFLQRVLPIQLLLMLEFFGRPHYLHDAPLPQVCSHSMDFWHVPKYVRPNWLFADSSSFVDKELVNEPTFFLGKAHSASYGMHMNIVKYDFFLVILQGKKRYAIFDADQHRRLHPTEILQNISVYLADPFTPDLVSTPRFAKAKGWAGELNAGELIYVPGDCIHSFENYDFNEPTAAVKFWYMSHEQVSACQGVGVSACARHFSMEMPREDEAAPSMMRYKDDLLKMRNDVQK